MKYESKVEFKYVIHQLLASPQMWTGIRAKHRGAWASSCFLFLLRHFRNPFLYSGENAVILLMFYMFCAHWYSSFMLTEFQLIVIANPAENFCSFASNTHKFINTILPSVVKHTENKNSTLHFFLSEENPWAASICLAFTPLPASL